MLVDLGQAKVFSEHTSQIDRGWGGGNSVQGLLGLIPPPCGFIKIL